MSMPPGKSLSPSGSRILPTSVSQVGTITKYELVNYFQSNLFFILLAIVQIINMHWVVARRFDSVSDGVSYLCCYNVRKRSLLFRRECPLPVRRVLELLNIISYRRTRIHFLLQFTLQEQLNVDPRDRHPLS